jgi:hypothetical protein
VLGNAISGRRVKLAGAWHRPVGMKGWTHVVFRRERDGRRHVRSLDDMLVHLDAWDRSAERRVRDRRRTSTGEGAERRRLERRAPVDDTLERRRASDLDVTPAVSNAPADLPSPRPEEAQAAAAPRVPAARTEAPLVIVSRTT